MNEAEYLRALGTIIETDPEMEQSACVCGCGGGGGASIFSDVFDDALWPLSSATLQVIETGPVGAPVDEYEAELPLPLMVPAEAE